MLMIPCDMWWCPVQAPPASSERAWFQVRDLCELGAWCGDAGSLGVSERIGRVRAHLLDEFGHDVRDDVIASVSVLAEEQRPL